MKYGPQRIAAMVAILVMLVLSGFYWYNADQKKNTRVIEKVKSESMTLLKSEEAQIEIKAIYLLIQERHDSGSLIAYLNSLDLSNRIRLANEVYGQILSFNKHREDSLKSSVRGLLVKNLENNDSTETPEFLMKERNKFLSSWPWINIICRIKRMRGYFLRQLKKIYMGCFSFLKTKDFFIPAFPWN